MSRKNSSEGTIYQLPSGHWRAQVCLDGRRISATRRTKVAARDWIREIYAQREAGLTYAGAQARLGEYITSWLESKGGHIRPATQQQYRYSIERYILPRIGGVRLLELTTGRVQAFIDELAREQVGSRTIQVVRIVLHGCLKQAQQQGLIGRNPVELVKSPKPPAREMRVWSESELSGFLVSVQGERNEMLYALALATGMRQGELLGLKWADIDWRGQVQVKRQAVELQGGGYAFAEPKSKRGIRCIEIGDGIIERLREQARRVELMRKMARERWQENDLVFPSAVGTPQTGSNLDRDFQRLVKRAGLPEIRFHDLRHTAATVMLSHGIPAVIVAGMLGHTLNVLMERYAHYIPTLQGEAARLMDNMTRPILIAHELPTKGKDPGHR
jgi:integrase